jgi:hypothetical protein
LLRFAGSANGRHLTARGDTTLKKTRSVVR